MLINPNMLSILLSGIQSISNTRSQNNHFLSPYVHQNHQLNSIIKLSEKVSTIIKVAESPRNRSKAIAIKWNRTSNQNASRRCWSLHSHRRLYYVTSAKVLKLLCYASEMREPNTHARPIPFTLAHCSRTHTIALVWQEITSQAIQCDVCGICFGKMFAEKPDRTPQRLCIFYILLFVVRSSEPDGQPHDRSLLVLQLQQERRKNRRSTAHVRLVLTLSLHILNCSHRRYGKNYLLYFFVSLHSSAPAWERIREATRDTRSRYTRMYGTLRISPLHLSFFLSLFYCSIRLCCSAAICLNS